jgi:hypothetical protein
MNEPTYQTVRLAKGRHAHPGQGVCVMELASMLAGEPFSDQPRSVCPVIASLLRTYNDRVDDERRQRLYPYASASVGTRAIPAVATVRARICAQWVKRQVGARRRRGIRGRLQVPFAGYGVDPPAIVAGRIAARGVMDGEPGAEEAMCALIERLIACGSDATEAPRAFRAPVLESSSA